MSDHNGGSWRRDRKSVTNSGSGSWRSVDNNQAQNSWSGSDSSYRRNDSFKSFKRNDNMPTRVTNNRWKEDYISRKDDNQRWNNKPKQNYSSGYGSNFNSSYRGNNKNWNSKNNNYGQKSFYKSPPPTDEEWKQMPIVEKNFYTPSAVTKNRSNMEIKKFLTTNKITINNGNELNPILTFSEASFPDVLQQKLLDQGFDKPTMIQSLTWPYAQGGRDLIGIAKTGSGKTLAFLLPALVHVTSLMTKHDRNGCKPIALVMLPTRELAQQVESVVKDFAPRGFRYTCVYGGAARNHQAHLLKYGCDLLVATPGRLIDFLESGEINLTACSYLVLDEADRMLDMGFEPQIRKILEFVRPDRQTLMWSATWPQKIRQLANDFLTNPVHFQVGSTELTANHDITQKIVVCRENEKYNHTLKLLDEITSTDDNKTIIFVETKKKCQQVADNLWHGGYSVGCIHGGKGQHERNRAIKDFRSGDVPILVATDVASRGIDVIDVRYIINYDFPGDIEGYVQRIGRTARAGQKGTSYSYFTGDNSRLANDLIKIMEEANQEVDYELRMYQGYGGGGNRYGGGGRYQDRRPYSRPSYGNMTLGDDSNSGFIMTPDGPVMRSMN